LAQKKLWKIFLRAVFVGVTGRVLTNSSQEKQLLVSASNKEGMFWPKNKKRPITPAG